MSRIFPYALWVLFSLPAMGMVIGAINAEDTRAIHDLLHPSGEFSARFLIISLMATPLVLLLRDWRGPRWLMKNRRYFGVAAFGYAVLHTLFYLFSEPLNRILAELTDFEIWTGWLAFAIFLPLAATSMDYMVRKLGRLWKPLQRWTYAAAILTLLHWASLHNWESPMAAIVHFAPLALLSAYRIWWFNFRTRQSAP